jgi:hypothetical protein
MANDADVAGALVVFELEETMFEVEGGVKASYPRISVMTTESSRWVYGFVEDDGEVKSREVDVKKEVFRFRRLGLTATS